MISEQAAAAHQRMQQRIQDMSETSMNHLPTTHDLFSATAALQKQIRDQQADALTLIGDLEGGSDADEAWAYRLENYSAALESALDPAQPAPHYQAVSSGLDQRLEPDQFEQVMSTQTMQACADASLENALYSGGQAVTGEPHDSWGLDAPSRYIEQKRSWDHECSAATIDGRNYGYAQMSPVKEAVREVMTDEQLITHDQRQIDAVMLGHAPMAERMGIDPLERQAVELYGAPMLDHHQSIGPEASATEQMLNMSDLTGDDRSIDLN